jgi:hypothetical protein
MRRSTGCSSWSLERSSQVILLSLRHLTTWLRSASDLLLQPLDQFRQRLAPMRNLVLLRLRHLRVRLALVLEARVPAYATISSANFSPLEPILGQGTYQNPSGLVRVRSCPAHTVSMKSKDVLEIDGWKTYVCTTLEDNHLLTRPRAVRKCADGPCGLILEAGEEFVKVLDAEGFEEPFP